MDMPDTKQTTFNTDTATLLMSLKNHLSQKSDWSRAYIENGASFFKNKDCPFLHVGSRADNQNHKVSEVLIDLLFSSNDNIAYFGEVAMALAKILAPDIEPKALAAFLGEVFREHGKEFKCGSLRCVLNILKDQSFLIQIRPD